MLYNLNLPVRVRLTVKGIAVMERKYYENINRNHLPLRAFKIPETDKDGWTTFAQASDLFETFGGYNWFKNEPFGMEVDFCGSME